MGCARGGTGNSLNGAARHRGIAHGVAVRGEHPVAQRVVNVRVLQRASVLGAVDEPKVVGTWSVML